MPIGKYVTEEERAKILRLLAQGLSPKIVSIRTGLHPSTIYRIGEQAKELKGGPGENQ